MREALNIAKEDFYDLIIDVIKQKRQIIVEAVIVKVLDSYLIKEEDQEIGQVFSQLCAPKFEEVRLERKKDVTTQGCGRGKDHRRVRRGKRVEYGIDINKINIYNYIFYRRFKGEKMSVKFAHLF